MSQFLAHDSPLLEGRSRLYQMILVQTIYDRRDKFKGVAKIINNHPLLVEVEDLVDDEECERFYNVMVDYYDARSEGSGRRKGVSSTTELLAHKIYSDYVEELLGLIEGDKQKFKTLYGQLNTMIPK